MLSASPTNFVFSPRLALITASSALIAMRILRLPCCASILELLLDSAPRLPLPTQSNHCHTLCAPPEAPLTRLRLRESCFAISQASSHVLSSSSCTIGIARPSRTFIHLAQSVVLRALLTSQYSSSNSSIIFATEQRRCANITYSSIWIAQY